MSAQVDTNFSYQAVCIDCAWWGPRVESEDTAEEDAFEHNMEQHQPQEDTK